MAIIVYRSTDASAPALQGAAGRLIAVLDACLVTGYGSKPAAGWTKAFTGTNLAAYRMTTTSPATGYYLRVDDTGTTSGRVVGYQTMTDVNTGTNVFPTAVQQTGGLFIQKSQTADTTARPWVVIADNTNPRCFHMFIEPDTTIMTATNTNGQYNNYFFGDIITRKATDGSECFIMAQSVVSTNNDCRGGSVNIVSSFNPLVGHFIGKNYTDTVVSQTVSKSLNTRGVVSQSVIGADNATVFPNLVTNQLDLPTIMIMESAVIMRGILPGSYSAQGGASVARPFDTLAGGGTFAGTTFTICPVRQGATFGMMAVNTSIGTWY